MLKVTVHNRPDEITLVLEGRLCGACAAEAERSWRTALATAASGSIAVDLAGVSYVDRDGEWLLIEMLTRGATVRVGGVWMAHLIEELQRRIMETRRATSRRAPRPHGSPGVS
jgi:ABC-type transporter Mla MlaB component